MTKKLLIVSLITLFTLMKGAAQSADNDLLVTMPVPPENLERLDERSTYIVEKYWDTFNPKSSFSSLARLQHTMDNFFGVAIYADANVVHTAIDRLIEKVAKAKADNLVTLAQMAEVCVYSDSADYISEEIYYPFVKAVATNKKVKNAQKARYAAQYKQLSNSQKDMVPADFTFTRPDGTTGTLSQVTTPFTVLFFYDPECLDCRLAKAQLSADYAIPTLIDSGQFTVMAIYPGEATDEWREDAKSLPENWVIGAWPEADTLFTMRKQPQFYVLDKHHKIIAKDIPVENIINTFGQYVKVL